MSHLGAEGCIHLGGGEALCVGVSQYLSYIWLTSSRGPYSICGLLVVVPKKFVKILFRFWCLFHPRHAQMLTGVLESIPHIYLTVGCHHILYPPTLLDTNGSLWAVGHP